MVSGSGISWAISNSAPRSRQITMPAPPPLSFLQAGCPSCRPTNSVKALKAQSSLITKNKCRPVPSVLWHCWLGIRKSIQPVKIKWRGVGVVICLEWGADLQTVCIWSSWCHCIPKPHHFLPHLNPDWLYLSDTGLPKLSWKRGH